MANRIQFKLIIMLFVSACITGLAHAEPPSWSSEQQAVIDAMKNGPVGVEDDFDTWADGYAQDWTYWRVGDANIRPRDEHMRLVREYIDGGNRPTAFELEPVDVIVKDDIAILRLVASETLLEANGEERTVRYASATILTRDTGDWQILATNIVYLDD